VEGGGGAGLPRCIFRRGEWGHVLPEEGPDARSGVRFLCARTRALYESTYEIAPPIGRMWSSSRARLSGAATMMRHTLRFNAHATHAFGGPSLQAERQRALPPWARRNGRFRSRWPARCRMRTIGEGWHELPPIASAPVRVSLRPRRRPSSADPACAYSAGRRARAAAGERFRCLRLARRVECRPWQEAVVYECKSALYVRGTSVERLQARSSGCAWRTRIEIMPIGAFRRNWAYDGYFRRPGFFHGRPDDLKAMSKLGTINAG